MHVNEIFAQRFVPRRRIEWKKDFLTKVLFLVGAGGFGPPKSQTTDLQSAPFGHSGTLPFMKIFSVAVGCPCDGYKYITLFSFCQ